MFYFKVQLISTCAGIWKTNIPRYKNKVFFLFHWTYVLHQNYSSFPPLSHSALGKALHTQPVHMCTYTYSNPRASNSIYRKSDVFISATALITPVASYSLEVTKSLKGAVKYQGIAIIVQSQTEFPGSLTLLYQHYGISSHQLAELHFKGLKRERC